jgi:hypothetical protein
MMASRQRTGWLMAAALGVLSLLPFDSARAETVLVDSSTLVSSTQSYVFPFTVTGPGTVEVILTDLVWTEQFNALALAITTATDILQQLSQAGALTFTVGAAGQYYALVTGKAGGLIKLGLFGLHVRYHPPTPTVPLPAAALLLLSGLGALGGAGLRRRAARREASSIAA